MTFLLKNLRKAALLTLVLIFLCGIVYPLLMTGIGQVFFKTQANGSIILHEGEAVGSLLVGQDFTDARLMKCRPSAVSYNTYSAEQKADGSYGGLASGSQNLAPTNEALVERVQEDIAIFLAQNPQANGKALPADLLTASGSGLDPHISSAAALAQIPALALASGLSEADLQDLVKQNTRGRQLGIFGEETVNVLQVNIGIATRIALV